MKSERTDCELLPCPFCGSREVLLSFPTCNRQTPYNPLDKAFPSVFCPGCFASIPGKDWDDRGGSAIDAWNRRAATMAKDNANGR